MTIKKTARFIEIVLLLGMFYCLILSFTTTDSLTQGQNMAIFTQCGLLIGFCIMCDLYTKNFFIPFLLSLCGVVFINYMALPVLLSDLKLYQGMVLMNGTMLMVVVFAICLMLNQNEDFLYLQYAMDLKHLVDKENDEKKHNETIQKLGNACIELDKSTENMNKIIEEIKESNQIGSVQVVEEVDKSIEEHYFGE